MVSLSPQTTASCKHNTYHPCLRCENMHIQSHQAETCISPWCPSNSTVSTKCICLLHRNSYTQIKYASSLSSSTLYAVGRAMAWDSQVAGSMLLHRSTLPKCHCAAKYYHLWLPKKTRFWNDLLVSSGTLTPTYTVFQKNWTPKIGWYNFIKIDPLWIIFFRGCIGI